AGDHDERLPGEERAELGRDEGHDAAADLGRRPLDAGSPLNGALAVMKQRAHTARPHGRGARGARDDTRPPRRSLPGGIQAPVTPGLPTASPASTAGCGSEIAAKANTRAGLAW